MKHDIRTGDRPHKGLWTVAILAPALVASAAIAAQAELTPSTSATSTSSPADLQISGELASVCRNSHGREQIEMCLEGVKSSLAGVARRFSGWRAIDSNCIGRKRVKAFIEGVSTEASQFMVRAHTRATNQFVGEGELIIRTAMISSTQTSYYMTVHAIENDVSANCRYSAVSWLAFAVIALKDGSVLVRSDALAGDLDSIVEKHLTTL